MRLKNEYGSKELNQLPGKGTFGEYLEDIRRAAPIKIKVPGDCYGRKSFHDKR
jgi:hypothetical protein